MVLDYDPSTDAPRPNRIVITTTDVSQDDLNRLYIWCKMHCNDKDDFDIMIIRYRNGEERLSFTFKMVADALKFGLRWTPCDD